MGAYIINRRQWQDLINTADDFGHVKVEGPTFAYYDNPEKWEITVKAGSQEEEFEYKNSGIDQAQERARDFLIRLKAIEFLD